MNKPSHTRHGSGSGVSFGNLLESVLSNTEALKGAGPAENAASDRDDASAEERLGQFLAAINGGTVTKSIDQISEIEKFLDLINEKIYKLTNNKLCIELLLLPTPENSPPQLTQPESPRSLAFADILAVVPADVGYRTQAQQLAEMNHDFRREMAARLEPAINAHVRAMPHETYEEKKTLSKWVNDELRRFDLAIKCPKTGEPSILLAGPGNHPEIGRFMLEHKSSDGKRVRPVQTPGLPHLELMEANPRREAFLEWRDKVGPQRGGSGRG